MKRRFLIVVMGILLIGVGPLFVVAAGTDAAVISLRIEGAKGNLYNNATLSISTTDSPTLGDVIGLCDGTNGIPKITVEGDENTSHILEIEGLKENTVGGVFQDVWMIRINGVNADTGLELTPIGNGDEIVVYYGDATLMQYPKIDLSRMISNGIIRFTSDDTTSGGQENTLTIDNPISGATVTWDGMTYITDASGEIIIDSTGAGVKHTIQIERYYANGLMTVLRLAPGYTVKYGFEDVSVSSWYYNAVVFVSDQDILRGVSDTTFAPDAQMNRAMFVTVLGRLMQVAIDQTEETSFSDVVDDGWSVGYIAWAEKNGIVSGYDDGTFGQYKNITREQLAVLLYRFAVFSNDEIGATDIDLAAFPDSGNISPYALVAMSWAVEKGIVTGNAGHLDPLGPATRAQVATMLERFMTVYP